MRYAKLASIGWGVLCLLLATSTEAIADTVIVAMGKIGSITYGPILAVFVLAATDRRAHATGANIGLVIGLLINLYLSLVATDWLFWIWWNVTGFFGAYLGGLVASRLLTGNVQPLTLALQPDWSALRSREAGILLVWFVITLVVSFWWPDWLGG